MNGNTMWLVCVHHPDRTQALQLGRRVFGAYDKVPHKQAIEAFLHEHATCGGGFDHFTIAFDQPKDHDLPKPAPLADAVHAVLRDPPEAANYRLVEPRAAPESESTACDIAGPRKTP